MKKIMINLGIIIIMDFFCDRSTKYIFYACALKEKMHTYAILGILAYLKLFREMSIYIAVPC